MRLPTFYEQNLIPNWGIKYLRATNITLLSKYIEFTLQFH